MLACRSTIIDKYHDGSLVLMFKLTNGRYIVGYALGEKGMLFRGELITSSDDEDAKTAARRIADRFAELDAQDEYVFQASQAEHERLMDIEYRCPECGHEWQEQWSSACDSECPHCGLKEVTALSWDEAKH
jgi:DNA-directed RNA polymerase subunit RPC12/RpoP